MKTVLLFLDESKPNGHNIKHMCLGGVIIEEDMYQKVKTEIDILKDNIFSNKNIILHEKEIRRATNGFQVLRREEKREEFWESLKQIFLKNKLTTLGVAIDSEKYKDMYKESANNDCYFIVLQIILENFMHYLAKKDCRGYVYIESQNIEYDKMLRNHYHRIIANGTLYLNKDILQERLLNINFLRKEDNSVGLQLADFVPGLLNRNCNLLPPKEPSILKTVEDLLYDGELNLKDRFGFKILL
ncbi:DUF3800 domain-containing protein [Fusobacterium varium]